MITIVHVTLSLVNVMLLMPARSSQVSTSEWGIEIVQENFTIFTNMALVNWKAKERTRNRTYTLLFVGLWFEPFK